MVLSPPPPTHTYTNHQVARDNEGVIFVDRNPRWFELILDAIREPNYAPALPLTDALFQRELEYYGLLHVFLPPQLRQLHPRPLTARSQLSCRTGNALHRTLPASAAQGPLALPHHGPLAAADGINGAAGAALAVTGEQAQAKQEGGQAMETQPLQTDGKPQQGTGETNRGRGTESADVRKPSSSAAEIARAEEKEEEKEEEMFEISTSATTTAASQPPGSKSIAKAGSTTTTPPSPPPPPPATTAAAAAAKANQQRAVSPPMSVGSVVPAKQKAGAGVSADAGALSVPSKGLSLTSDQVAANAGELEKLIVVGGFDEKTPLKFLRTAEAYNPRDDKWEPLSDMFWDRSHSGVLTHGQNLYVLGGRNEKPDGVVGHFNNTQQTWQEAVDMLLPVPVFAAGFAVFRGMMMLVGGCYEALSSGKPDRVSNRVFEFPLDPARNYDSNRATAPQWKQSVANLNMARGRHQCAVLRGHLYAIGGVDAHGNVLSSVECFNPRTKVWEQVAPLPKPRRDFGCTVADGCIFVIGGADTRVGTRSGPTCVNTVFCYSLESKEWEEMPGMQNARQGLSCSLFGGKIYAIGGSVCDDCRRGASSSQLKLVERFNLNSQTWEPVADLTAHRSHPGSGVVQGIGVA